MVCNPGKKDHGILISVVVSNIVYFHPENWENDPI